MTDLLWQPGIDRLNHSAMAEFLRAHPNCDSYADLHQWSIDNVETFWSDVWDYCDIIGEKGPKPWLSSERIFKAQFFPQGSLNYAENCLRAPDDQLALIGLWENGDQREVSFKELRHMVAAVSEYLKHQGVVPGDVVAGFLPHGIHAVVACLATAAIGATWSSCSPDFGVAGLVDRFGQVEPKVLFTINAYHYNGKLVSITDKIDAIVEQLPSLRSVVVESYIDSAAMPNCNHVQWNDCLATDNNGIQYVRVPFNHPLFVLYSSGTTGKPKCIEHSVGGALLQHQKEHVFHGDIKAGDRLMYFTTCGWMMWNWQLTALAAGATLVCYDGSPFFEGPQCMWSLSEQLQITHFGTSAKYIAAIEKADYKPREQFGLADLRVIFSTGSPLAPEGFDFVYQHIKNDVMLASIAGGTDLLGCFAAGNPIMPVYRGELQSLALGMATNVFDEEAKPLTTEKGELVCTKPFVSMPLRFVGDEGDKKYHGAYFEKFDNIWAHGDFAEITQHGGLIIYGRSDALLNPGGVRIGTAEIYREVESFEEVAESICIGQQWDDDVRVVLFLKMADGYDLNDDLRVAIAKRIREQNTPRHVPAKMIEVSDIPRTLSGKITEVAVRQVVHNETVKNTDALANPEALELFKNLPELQS